MNRTTPTFSVVNIRRNFPSMIIANTTGTTTESAAPRLVATTGARVANHMKTHTADTLR